MAARPSATPSRTLLPSPMDRTPPSSTKKRALNELSINLPPRPHSAQDFTTPEHPTQYKRYRKVSEPLSAPFSASSLTSSGSKRESPGEDPVWGPEVEAAFMSGKSTTSFFDSHETYEFSHTLDTEAWTEKDLHWFEALRTKRTDRGLHLSSNRQAAYSKASLLAHPGLETHSQR